ncbi:hypothetical protein [Pseudomonas mosselii]|uniref:hypothetical protein n=1 Tax=Pseudomonas mosselii TaxID=78327 RepID=UPI001F364011|nr:hypothetical protein [Pseudomonas mosselii]
MSIQLLEAQGEQKLRANINKYYQELLDRLKQYPFFSDAQAKETISARDSSDFFYNCITAMENEFSQDLNSYSTMRWMYYLRRLPHRIFAGDLNSTAPNARALIEVYANLSAKTESANYGRNGFTFPLNDSTLRHIARFAAFTNIIYDLQVGFRFANKGFDYSFKDKPPRAPNNWPLMAPPTDRRITLPQRIPNPELESAVKIYDLRHNRNLSFLGKVMNQAGLAHAKAVETEAKPELDVSCASWAMISEEFISPHPYITGHPHAALIGINAKVMAKYYFNTLDLDRIFELYRHPALVKVSVDTHAALCLIVLLLGGRWLKNNPYSFLRTIELGYFITNIEPWKKFCAEQYNDVCALISNSLPGFKAPGDFEAFYTSCQRFKGEVWPTAHGAPAKATNDYMCIDMWAASTGFLGWFQFPKMEGEVANHRAVKFEDVVQDAVNSTRWGNGQYQELRQRTLRVNGKQLTDIDAIGYYEDSLLIISCKSISYTREYDRGTHSAVRNPAATVDKAVEFWAKIVSQLSESPIGDNFDLSACKQIIGVVCTPYAIYTSNQKTLSATSQDLRWACSLDELIEFLAR